VQFPLLSGVSAKGAEWVQRPPLNLEPVPVDSGISKGQFVGAAGAVPYATGPGIDRGGIYWNNTHYRVMGTKLVRVNARCFVDTLGDVGGSGPVSLDYSFDRLIIRSGTALYYWNGIALTQVTDADLGPVDDAIWISGYTMTTDGTYVIVTELSDPTSVLPLKYGSAESDPDPVTGLLKNRHHGRGVDSRALHDPDLAERRRQRLSLRVRARRRFPSGASAPRRRHISGPASRSSARDGRRPLASTW
jgi:hypothetical protein